MSVTALYVSDDQLVTYARHAGFIGEQQNVAGAVAIAESAGNAHAIGDVALEDSVWGPSVGLMQIRSLRADRGTGRTRDELANLDSATNMRHAYDVFLAGRGWTPWSTYVHHTHQQFMTRIRTAISRSIVPTYTRQLAWHGGTTYQQGDDVRDCQEIVLVRVDGLYGPATANAVKTWQAQRRIAVDGIVGPITAHLFGWR